MKKKFLNIIVKSSRIRNRFKNIVGGKPKENHHNHHNHNNNHNDGELDDHNDSSNWSYA
jgi:hypothetical protein